MSQLPEVSIDLLAERFLKHGVLVEEHERGIRLRTINGARTYRLTPTDDGFVLGTQLFYACRVFDINAFEIVYG